MTSGRTWREIAEELGIGPSTLTRWPVQMRAVSEPSEAPLELYAELE
jgi:transposase